MTPELLANAAAAVEAAMFDTNGNGPWLDLADAELRKWHVIDQAMILGMAFGVVETDVRYAAWKHLLERFLRRNEGASPLVDPPGLHRIPRPDNLRMGAPGGFRRRSRHR